MKRMLLLIVLSALVLSVPAMAGSATVTTSPDPTVAGGTFDATICGIGGKTVQVRVTAPDGSITTGQAYGPNCVTMTFSAPLAGEYTVEILNYSGKHVLASATETAL